VRSAEVLVGQVVAINHRAHLVPQPDALVTGLIHKNCCAGLRRLSTVGGFRVADRRGFRLCQADTTAC
jgi:hypothetical protein